MRVLLAVAAMLSLTGCALPPALTIASIALDVGSYVVSGKSVADHGMSLAFQRDCAVANILDDGELCEPETVYEVATGRALQPLTPDQLAQALEQHDLPVLLTDGVDYETPASNAASDRRRGVGEGQLVAATYSREGRGSLRALRGQEPVAVPSAPRQRLDSGIGIDAGLSDGLKDATYIRDVQPLASSLSGATSVPRSGEALRDGEFIADTALPAVPMPTQLAAARDS